MAVQGHGQNAGDGGFAYAPVSAEDVAMRNPLLLDGIFQGAGNMVLPDNPRKALRTIFAREYLITHGKSDYTLAGASRFSTLKTKRDRPLRAQRLHRGIRRKPQRTSSITKKSNSVGT